MVLIPQPLPWSQTGDREIGDGAGNVVQYTNANLGLICLVVNSHARMQSALAKIPSLLYGDGSGDEAIRTIIQEALGKIGFAALAAKIENAPAGSPTLDRAVATELQVPEAAYSSSTDAALSLAPSGWTLALGTKSLTDPLTGGTTGAMVAALSKDGKSVTAMACTIQLAICAAAIRATEA